RMALSFRTEAELYSLAADLLDDLADRFLPQVRQALDQATAGLHAVLARRGEDAPARVVERWPDELSPSVPPTLLPTPNEVLLTAPESFPFEFDRLLEPAFSTTPRAAFSLAVREVISGAWPTRLDPDDSGIRQDLFELDPAWSPSVEALR